MKKDVKFNEKIGTGEFGGKWLLKQDLHGSIVAWHTLAYIRTCILTCASFQLI